MRAIGSACLLLITFMAAACRGEVAEGGAGDLPQPVVRDSSGVRIVENAEPAAAGWRADAEPLFTVGWAPDDPTFTWTQSGRVLPDGGALVGDFGSGTLYRLASDGSLAATWGRKGEGPGEYQAFEAIILSGDSILVSDGRLGRVTALSSDGEVLATHRLPGAGLNHVSSILSDGSLLVVPGEGYSSAPEVRPEWVFETQPILAADVEAGTADTVAVLPHLRRWYGVRGGTPGPVHVKGRAGGFVDGFAFARTDEAEVAWYDGSGRLVQVARWAEDPVPLTTDRKTRMVRAYDEWYRAQGADESLIADRLAQLEEGLERYEGPIPYWDSFLVDRRGNAWLREYPVIPVEPSATWRVVTRDGVFVGRVDLPDVIAILDVTDDRILAVRYDELDVPAVVMLELTKP